MPETLALSLSAVGYLLHAAVTDSCRSKGAFLRHKNIFSRGEHSLAKQHTGTDMPSCPMHALVTDGSIIGGSQPIESTCSLRTAVNTCGGYQQRVISAIEDMLQHFVI